MPAKALEDEAIIRFLRFSVVESAAATFTEQNLDTQLSIERGVIWMLHWVQVEYLVSNLDDPTQNADENLVIQITRDSKTGIVSYNDSDVIEQFSFEHTRAATIGTDAGPMWLSSVSPIKMSYSPAIPFAGSSIFVGVQSTAGAARTVQGRLAYTIRAVSDKFFFRVAQALVG